MTVSALNVTRFRLLSEILKETPEDVEEIEYLTDGSWRPIRDDKEKERERENSRTPDYPVVDICKVFFLLKCDPGTQNLGMWFFGGGGLGLVDYCMIIEIMQMALSHYLNKLRKDCFLKHHGRNGPESAARARGAICRTVKSIQMIQSTKRELNQRLSSELVTRPGDFLWMVVRIWDC